MRLIHRGQPRLVLSWQRVRSVVSRSLLVVAVALGGACACDPPPSAKSQVPGPEQPLRSATRRGPVPPAARVADYRIDASLDTSRHRIRGTAYITWRNRTARGTRQLRFHQYMNAFRADDTLWLREGGSRHRGNTRPAESWGYLDVQRVVLVPDASGSVDPEEHAAKPMDRPAVEEFVGTSGSELVWREDDEPTLMTVELPRTIGPGENVTVAIDFETQLPEVFARTGHHDGFYLVAQWYPKLAVFDEHEGWRAHPFTYHSEFFADFGHYDVRLDVPSDLEVGASGTQIERREADGRTTHHYRADMVHDFAWTAFADFRVHTERIDDIHVRLLSSHPDPAVADEHLATQVAALHSYEARYGPYPWSTITIVEPPPGAEGAGGMEYPTFYAASAAGDSPRLPAWLFQERFSTTFTTLHEFGHQYFQGLVASDEYRDPWLDEGINSASNVIALFDRFGASPWVIQFLGHDLAIDDVVRLAVHDNVAVLPVSSGSNEFHPQEGSYHRAVYEKTAALLLTLRNLVGAPRFDEALRRYALTFRFRHPTPADFESVLLDELGTHPQVIGAPAGVRLDLEAYLHETLHRTAACNFAVQRIVNRPRPRGTGWHRGPDGKLIEQVADPDATATPYADREGRVTLTRQGDWPVEVKVEFADGAIDSWWWFDRERFVVRSFPGQEIVSVSIDPERRYLLETHRHDNRRWAPEAPMPTRVGEHLAQWSELLALFAVGAAAL